MTDIDELDLDWEELLCGATQPSPPPEEEESTRPIPRHELERYLAELGCTTASLAPRAPGGFDDLLDDLLREHP